MVHLIRFLFYKIDMKFHISFTGTIKADTFNKQFYRNNKYDRDTENGTIKANTFNKIF